MTITQSQQNYIPYAAEPPAASLVTFRIMIVDDEPATSRVVRRHLEHVGYTDFVLHTDSTTAVDAIEREHPDVVLLDIVMPHVSGLDILRTLRTHRSLARVPVVILTASTDSETKLQALELGANDFLAKPVDPSELVLRIRNVLNAKALQDHLTDYADELQHEVSRRTAQLTASQRNVSLSYLAGKAEIAVEVLHNVGNVLNSANVSVTLLRRVLAESPLPLLVKAAELLLANADNPGFLSQDEHGKLLPTYFMELADSLTDEQKSLLSEIQSLERHVDHVKAVVATQQRYTCVSRFTELVSVAQLLDDATALLGLSREDHDIDVVRRYEQLPEIMLDKQKLFQVFVNLVKNAVESMAEQDGCPKRLELSIRRRDSNRVCVDFSDTGVGIPEQNVNSIFAYGFTTKRNGSGVGLHSCANLVKELGGRITTTSHGEGRGATFTIEVPIQDPGLPS